MVPNEKESFPYAERIAFIDSKTGIRYEFFAKNCHDNTVRDAARKFLGIKNIDEFVQHNFRFDSSLPIKTA